MSLSEICTEEKIHTPNLRGHLGLPLRGPQWASRGELRPPLTPPAFKKHINENKKKKKKKFAIKIKKIYKGN